MRPPNLSVFGPPAFGLLLLGAVLYMKFFSASITAVLMAVSVASSAQPSAAAKLAAATPGMAAIAALAPARAAPVPAAPAVAAALAPPAAPAVAPQPLRGAVLSGNTLYVSGQLDLDDQGKPGKTPQESARLALEHVKKVIEGAGFSMDDLVLVQVFSTDLKSFDAFNKVYRTYFTGPLPARAFMGAGTLLRGGHFEVLGIAVRPQK